MTNRLLLLCMENVQFNFVFAPSCFRAARPCGTDKWDERTYRRERRVM